MNQTFHAVPVQGTPILTASPHARRSLLGISPEHEADFWESNGTWVDAVDQLTGRPIQLRRRACGFRCMCDAEYRVGR